MRSIAEFVGRDRLENVPGELVFNCETLPVEL